MGRELTVYVVDDDRGVREALGRLLRAAGLRVRSCATPEELLEGDPPEIPGCVVVDLSSQRDRNRLLAERLHERGLPLPVIVLTGDERETVAREAHDAGARLFFRKPVDGRALLDAIEWVTSDDIPGRNP